MNPPIITKDNNNRIIDTFYIPEMHMKTGNVDKSIIEMEKSQAFTNTDKGGKICQGVDEHKKYLKSSHRETPSLKRNKKTRA